MAAHSSTLVWKIPWTEEAGGLQSIGSQSQTQLKRLSMHGPYYINAFVSIKHYTMTKTKYLFECYGLSFCTGKWPNHLLGQDVGEDATFTLENIF